MNSLQQNIRDAYPQPSSQLGEVDAQVYPSSDSVFANQFYFTCDQDTKGLLLNCTWGFITGTQVLTLLIKCPGEEVYWHILGSLSLLAKQLNGLTDRGRIRVYPPGAGSPLEVGAEDISAHR
jgi:hypothetical protein